MCGIAGFFGSRRADASVWETMLSALAPRGPDARHVVTWNGQLARSDNDVRAALVHTRLSIRDLRTAADQPMSNDTGDVWLSYNGEVYGWEQDAERLKAEGISFKTTSDTEFILHAYEAWGLDFLDKLRGMFAIALLDLRRRKLYLIRDRMGIKPLVYAHRAGEIAFGSTVRAVLPYLEPERRRVSPAAIDAYLAHRYVPAPRTIFEGIARLPQAHYACFDLDAGSLAVHRYWTASVVEHRDMTDVLTEAVRLRTVSDRPVGLFLSGGIDSATLASVLAAGSFRDITAYTAGFPGTSYDETVQAQAIAAGLGIPHRVLPITEQVGDDFERIVADLDEPFADPSSIPLWYLAREATQHVRVVMGGDGGDELFAGYKRYAKHLRSGWRGGLRLPLGRRGAVDALPGKREKLLDEFTVGWLEAYALRFSGMAPSLRRYLQPRFDVRATYWRDLPTRTGDPLLALLDLDMNNYLPEYILRKGDLCTMAHGLELRVPLLDHRLYQTVLGLPARERFTQPTKLALAPACAPCRELGLFDQRKRGFNPPVGPWLRGPLRGRLDGVAERLAALTDTQVDADRARHLIDAFLQGDDARAEHVLQLLILETSLGQLVDHG